MKRIVITLFLNVATIHFSQAQSPAVTERQQKAITALVAQYSIARENRDTVLLKTILTPDVDQLVSTGEWRTGISTAVQGMLKSSATKPGTRTLTVDKIRLLNNAVAVVDCRYDIQNADSTIRHMWSTFIVIKEKKQWKISAIRNMLPVKE